MNLKLIMENPLPAPKYKTQQTLVALTSTDLRTFEDRVNQLCKEGWTIKAKSLRVTPTGFAGSLAAAVVLERKERLT